MHYPARLASLLLSARLWSEITARPDLRFRTTFANLIRVFTGAYQFDLKTQLVRSDSHDHERMVRISLMIHVAVNISVRHVIMQQV